VRAATGERLLAAASEALAEARTPLQAITRLRRLYPADQVSAAVEQVELRRRAATKFADASQLFFTAEGLEQATGERVAAHRAQRFAGYSRAADLCCGIGGDLLALARVTRVLAVERDPLRLAIARANVEVSGLASCVEFVLGDALSVDLAGCEAAFCDPGRRGARGRVFDPARYEPPLPAVLALAERLRAFAIKAAPGIPYAAVPAGCEAEFVQDAAELKEAVIWLGRFVTASRRATLLPEGQSLVAGPTEDVPVSGPRAYLYEPAPALIRAHLVAEMAALLGAAQLDKDIAYLTADTRVPTPFATAYAVQEWLPFNLKALRRRLRELGVGRLTVKKRGSPLDPDEAVRLLAPRGPEERVLVLTRVHGRHSALICSGPLR
jgi:hypothetical protein